MQYIEKEKYVHLNKNIIKYVSTVHLVEWNTITTVINTIPNMYIKHK